MKSGPGTDRFTVVRHAIRNLFPAMIASSLSTIVIHFPFRLMSGLAGSFFKELSDTMQLTLVASFLVTWLLLPVLHLVIGYKKQLRPKDLDAKMLEENSIRKVHFLTCRLPQTVDCRRICPVFRNGRLVCFFPAFFRFSA